MKAMIYRVTLSASLGLAVMCVTSVSRADYVGGSVTGCRAMTGTNQGSTNITNGAGAQGGLTTTATINISCPVFSGTFPAGTSQFVGNGFEVWFNDTGASSLTCTLYKKNWTGSVTAGTGKASCATGGGCALNAQNPSWTGKGFLALGAWTTDAFSSTEVLCNVPTGSELYSYELYQ